jgi:hypothetical protein
MCGPSSVLPTALPDRCARSSTGKTGRSGSATSSRRRSAGWPACWRWRSDGRSMLNSGPHRRPGKSRPFRNTGSTRVWCVRRRQPHDLSDCARSRCRGTCSTPLCRSGTRRPSPTPCSRPTSPANAWCSIRSGKARDCGASSTAGLPVNALALARWPVRIYDAWDAPSAAALAGAGAGIAILPGPLPPLPRAVTGVPLLAAPRLELALMWHPVNDAIIEPFASALARSAIAGGQRSPLMD